MKRSNSFVNLELILPLESFRFTTSVRVPSQEEIPPEEIRTAPPMQTSFHRRFQSADATNSRQPADASGDRFAHRLPYSTSENPFFPSDFESPAQISSTPFGFFDDEVSSTHREKEIIRPRIFSVCDSASPDSPYSLDYGFFQESPGIRLAPGQPLRFVRNLSAEAPLYPPIVITTSTDDERPVAEEPPASPETMALLLDDASSAMLPTSSTTASSSDNDELLELDHHGVDDGVSSSSSIPETGCSKRFSASSETSENDSDSTRMELEPAPSGSKPLAFIDHREDGEDEGVNEMMTSMVSATGGDELGYQMLEDASDAEPEEREESTTPTPTEGAIPLDAIFAFDMKKSPSQELPVISEDADEHFEEERPVEAPKEAKEDAEDKPVFHQSEASTSSDSESAPTESSSRSANPPLEEAAQVIPQVSSLESFDFARSPSPVELTVVHRRSVSDHVTPSLSLLQAPPEESKPSPSHSVQEDEVDEEEEQKDLITDSPRLVRKRIVTGRNLKASGSRIYESRCKSQVLLGSKERSNNMLNKTYGGELDRSLSNSTPSINEIEGADGGQMKQKSAQPTPAPVSRRTSSVSVCESRTSSMRSTSSSLIGSAYAAHQGIGAPSPIRKKGAIAQPPVAVDFNQNLERRGSVARKHSTSQITARIKSIFTRGNTSPNAVSPNVTVPESPIYQELEERKSSSLISKIGKMRREKSDMSLFIASSLRTRKLSDQISSPPADSKLKEVLQSPVVVRSAPISIATFAEAEADSEPKSLEPVVKMRQKKSDLPLGQSEPSLSFRRSLDETALRLLRSNTHKKRRSEFVERSEFSQSIQSIREESDTEKFMPPMNVSMTLEETPTLDEEQDEFKNDEAFEMTTLQRRRRAMTPRKEDRLKHRIRADGHVEKKRDKPKDSRTGVFTFLSMRHKKKKPDQRSLVSAVNAMNSAVGGPRSSLSLGATPSPESASIVSGEQQFFADGTSVNSAMCSELGSGKKSCSQLSVLMGTPVMVPQGIELQCGCHVGGRESDQHRSSKPITKSASMPRSTKSPSVVEGWGAKKKIKMWRSRMSFNGSVMFRHSISPEPALVERKKSTVAVNTGRLDSSSSRLSQASLETITGIGKHLTADDIFSNITLIRKKWEDLDIWEPEFNSWSNKYSNIKDISSRERKKQDTIYELYKTEKNHCQTLIFLQQVYQVGVQFYNILSDTELNNLIPDVLDSLLDFHLSLLRRLRQRRSESPMVTTVSDIVLDEFANGPFTHAALAAYTTLCQHKDRSSHNYEVLMSKNSRFRKYFESVEGDPRYKERSFKYSLLLVAQRPTKYTILLDQLSKQEGSEFREEAFKAFEAVKSFVKRLDNNLAIMELHRRWDHIQSNLDRSSSGRYLDEKFSYEDLTHICKEDQRMILCIGQVQMKNVKEDRFDSVLMLLFDDILAFLQQKGGKYYFYNQSNHDCVIAVQSLLIRQVPRQTSLMIVVVDKKKSDMLEVMFNTKTDLTHWLHAFTSVKERPIVKVRRAPSQVHRLESVDEHDRNNDHSYSQEVEMEKWERELCELFSARGDEEKKFVDFFNRRMQWMDEVERHLSKVPGRQPKDTATAERLKLLVKSRYAELRSVRHMALDSLIERAEALRMNSVVSFYDDVHDLKHAPSSDSGPSTAEESDDTSESGSSSGRVKPRRIRTFHGTVEGQASRKKEGIRRHTTVPHLESSSDLNGSDGEELLHKMMALTGTARQRRAAKCLIKEAVSTRSENNKLKSELALKEAQIAALKMRKTTIGSSDTLEQLRTKQMEIQRQEQDAKNQDELRKDSLKRLEEELEQKTVGICIQLQQRENELEAKWQVFYEKTRNPCQSQAPAVVIEEGSLPSPTLPNGGSRLQHQQSFRYGSVVHDQARAPRSPQRNSPLMQPSMSLSSMQNLVTKTESKEVKKKSKK
ncbi:hypothetical protein QR680_009691 [Steinernema hermaphroditum]|uniref:DH domain-containing protein n=1 Tax=Steinernema hermaphroditum TaxID=289476 RepID=A0AA39M9C8_9BILA|nr:hypothetical protein QR680_009691 [Steinernema hermaphroditum]